MSKGLTWNKFSLCHSFLLLLCVDAKNVLFRCKMHQLFSHLSVESQASTEIQLVINPLTELSVKIQAWVSNFKIANGLMHDFTVWFFLCWRYYWTNLIVSWTPEKSSFFSNLWTADWPVNNSIRLCSITNKTCFAYWIIRLFVRRVKIKLNLFIQLCYRYLVKIV